MKTTAAVLYTHKNPLIIEELDLAAPQHGEVLVEIKAAGICHSDLSVLQGVFSMPPLPCVPGHEGAGIVREIGPGVDRVKVGDHVVLVWVPRCGQCYYCLHDQPYLCLLRDKTRAGAMPDGTHRLTKEGKPIFNMVGVGSFNRFNVISQTCLLPIDHDIPFEIAALVGCGVMTGVGAVINTARVRPGSSVAVLGIGGVGVNVIQGAVLAGATKIIAIDVLDSKLEIADRFGATHTINADSPDIQATVMELTGGIGVDYSFEMVGLARTAQLASSLIRRGGTTVFVGLSTIEEKLAMPIPELLVMEKKLLGCYYGSSNLNTDLITLLDLYKLGRLKVAELITARYTLEEINQGFDDLISGKNLRGVVLM